MNSLSRYYKNKRDEYNGKFILRLKFQVGIYFVRERAVRYDNESDISDVKLTQPYITYNKLTLPNLT